MNKPSPGGELEGRRWDDARTPKQEAMLREKIQQLQTKTSTYYFVHGMILRTPYLRTWKYGLEHP